MSALSVYEDSAGVGPFHILALVSLVTLISGFIPAFLRRPVTGWLDLHAYFMRWSYVGLVAAGAAQIATMSDSLSTFTPMTRLSFITLPGLWLSCALFGALSAPLAAQSARSTDISAEWRLLYATDSAGQPTRGEKAALIRAVRSGQPIRVGWKVPWRLADGTSGVLEHAASASFLTVHHGEVFAQLIPILGQAPVAREPRITLRTANPQLWYGLVSTTGELLGYFMGSDSATTVRVATEWYAPSAGLAAP